MRTPETQAAARWIGGKIRSRRTHLRLKQREIAGPYTTAYVSALEKGLVAPSLAALLHLSKALKVRPAYFLEGLSWLTR